MNMKTPVLKIGDILLTSMQEDLTDQAALDFQTDVLARVAEEEAKGFVMDISALEIVDSFMARVINDTANMVQLLGTEVVLCGMRPVVAVTLVEMGRELIGVRTALDLEQGMEMIRDAVSGGPEDFSDAVG